MVNVVLYWIGRSSLQTTTARCRVPTFPIGLLTNPFPNTRVTLLHAVFCLKFKAIYDTTNRTPAPIDGF